MVMQRVDLCDSIFIKLSDTPGIRVTCGRKGVPDGPANIAWRAARIMLDIAGTDQGAFIKITKNIPVAAGLGGGSSDAATVLMGLNELLELRLSDRRLMGIGLKLGADVPFFIFKKTALAEGIGEELSAMPAMPKAWILLVNPGIHVSTAWVYSTLQLTNRGELNRLPKFFANVEDLCSIFSNDLETVTIPAFPVIAEIKDHLLRLGAVASMMSGSGPTVFGLFRDKNSAERAGIELSDTNGWFVAVAETL
jgi:4-diphosphocytidyl-2-C-methyl-D-erythritol kinase